MNTVQKSGVAILMLSAIGLAACDGSKPGPVETAGRNVDQAARTAGNAVGDAAEKTGQAISDAADKTGQALGDAAITSKIKGAILAESGLQSLQIHVATTSGVVTLSGSVNSQENSDKAASIAAAVDGVNDVENRLMVIPNS
jgi:hyperosmotically inducible periplasmic protein